MGNDDWGFDTSANTAQSTEEGWDLGENHNNDLSPKGLNWSLLLTEMLVLPAIVFAAFYLLRRSTDTSVVETGLMFMLPTATLMIAALLLDYQTERMTPRFSRNAQWLVILFASVIAFCIGCFGQLSYLGFVYQPQNYVIIVDKSDSMGYNSAYLGGYDPENQRETAVMNLLDNLPDGTSVGLVLFNNIILKPIIKLQPLNDILRVQIQAALKIGDSGGTDFYQPFCMALDMVQAENVGQKDANSTRIVFLTDGEASISSFENDSRDIIEECLAYNVSVSCVQMGQSIQDDLQTLIDETGGIALVDSAASALFSDLFAVSDIQTTDVLRDDSSTSLWISLTMFLLTGLTMGIGLSLMFSLQREFRVQYILSPLLGIAAFVVCKWLIFDPGWVHEASAFSLYGLVFMRINRGNTNVSSSKGSIPSNW